MAQKARISLAQMEFAEGFIRKQRRGRYSKDIAKDLNKAFKKSRFRELASSTIINLISKIHNQEDQEWTFVNILDIPTESIPAVLQVWKESKVSESSFSVREAKWCARLSTFVKDLPTLRSLAWAYANRERAYMMLGKPPDTSDFDTILTTPPWELVTGYLTGEIKPMAHGIYRFDRVRTHIVPREALPKDTSDRFQYPVAPPIFAPVVIELDFVTLCGAAQVAEMAFLGGVEKRVVRHETVASYSLDERYIDAILQELEIESRYTEMPVVGQLGFSQEQLRVYTLWLHYLAKGPGISRLVGETPTKKVSRELNRRLQIVCELREWVKNHELAKGSSCLLPNANDLDFLDYLDREYKLKPVELLKKAGYEV